MLQNNHRYLILDAVLLEDLHFLKIVQACCIKYFWPLLKHLMNSIKDLQALQSVGRVNIEVAIHYAFLFSSSVLLPC